MRRAKYAASWIRPLTVAAMIGIGAANANAGLILSPLGGFTVFSSGDDETSHVALDSSFSFYGQSFDAIDISTNGNLNFTGYSGFTNVAFPDANTGAMIAPLWDDFSLFGNSRIIQQQGDGFFAVTWSNVTTFSNPGSRDTFQAILFNKDRDFGGFSFNAGDIAFAYGPLGPDLSFDGNATVGVNNDAGSLSAGLPNGDSLIVADDLDMLQPIKTQFILLRYNGTNYDVSYQTTEHVVPEPATLGAVVFGLLALATRRKRRRSLGQ